MPVGDTSIIVHLEFLTTQHCSGGRLGTIPLRFLFPDEGVVHQPVVGKDKENNDERK
jgi:hypothetical protein